MVKSITAQAGVHWLWRSVLTSCVYFVKYDYLRKSDPTEIGVNRPAQTETEYVVFFDLRKKNDMLYNRYML